MHPQTAFAKMPPLPTTDRLFHGISHFPLGHLQAEMGEQLIRVVVHRLHPKLLAS